MNDLEKLIFFSVASLVMIFPMVAAWRCGKVRHVPIFVLLMVVNAIFAYAAKVGYDHNAPTSAYSQQRDTQ